MVEMTKCPLCKARVAIVDGKTCPACRGDITDENAIKREARIDEIYSLLWQGYQGGVPLRKSIEQLTVSGANAADEINLAKESFVKEGRYKILYPGQKHFYTGLAIFMAGTTGTALSFFWTIPLTVVFWGAIAVGLADLLFGLYEIARYRRFFPERLFH